MAVYCISYDLKSDEYKNLIEAIKAYGLWWHQSESTWFIETTQTAKQILENLKVFLKSGDKLIIIQVKQHWCALGHTEKEYDWMKSRKF
ncbi:hypothetical protein Barb4_01580 [Bacteroidales bacterium Barb4]|nr:hypothetical protein Barb4_01580 [Bacteroidales bacterium Barb4]